MNLPEDFKNWEPVAFFDMDENERAIAAVAVIALILFLNWTGAL